MWLSIPFGIYPQSYVIPANGYLVIFQSLLGFICWIFRIFFTKRKVAFNPFWDLSTYQKRTRRQYDTSFNPFWDLSEIVEEDGWDLQYFFQSLLGFISKHPDWPKLKVQTFNPFWDLSWIFWCFFAQNPTFNPFWDLSKVFKCPFCYRRYTFNPFWDLSIECEGLTKFHIKNFQSLLGFILSLSPVTWSCLFSFQSLLGFIALECAAREWDRYDFQSLLGFITKDRCLVCRP